MMFKVVFPQCSVREALALKQRMQLVILPGAITNRIVREALELKQRMQH